MILIYRLRHYWSLAENNKINNLNEDGSLALNTTYTGNKTQALVLGDLFKLFMVVCSEVKCLFYTEIMLQLFEQNY